MSLVKKILNEEQHLNISELADGCEMVAQRCAGMVPRANTPEMSSSIHAAYYKLYWAHKYLIDAAELLDRMAPKDQIEDRP